MTDTTKNPTSELDKSMMVFMYPSMRKWEYRGSRAALVAEGIIPADLVWPHGDSHADWESGRLSYRLFRLGRGSVKGAVNGDPQGDVWSLRCSFNDGLNDASRAIAAKRQELRQEIHAHSVAGRREADQRIERHSAARRDMAFQAFKALILPARKKPNQQPKSGKSTRTSGTA